MKVKGNSITTIIIALISVPLFAQVGGDTIAAMEDENPKDLRSWSVGVRGLFLYDLPATLYDTQLSTDPRGLNGDNTSADFGFEAYIEKQFTPFFGLQGLYRMGGLTGANATEYYENGFSEGRLAASLIWSNLDPNHVGSKWNFYNSAGAGFGSFTASRYLISDDSETETVDDSYAVIFLNGGIQYELAPSWRLNLEVGYNVVRHDGFDGFDYATGLDPYLSAGLGVAYTFGPKEKPAMYATNYFEAPYYDLATQKAQMAELENQMKEMEKKRKEEMKEMREGLKTGSEQNQQQDEAISGLSERVEGLENRKSATIKDYKAVVFFDFDSSTLTREAKQNLVEMLSGQSGPYKLVGYADATGPDNYNEKLKQRRAEAVKQFLVEQMGVSPEEVTIETADIADAPQDPFLKRRVEVR